MYLCQSKCRHELSGLPGTHIPGQLLFWNSGSGYEIYTHSEMKIRRENFSCYIDCNETMNKPQIVV